MWFLYFLSLLLLTVDVVFSANQNSCRSDNCLRALSNPLVLAGSHIFCSAYIRQITVTPTVYQLTFTTKAAPTKVTTTLLLTTKTSVVLRTETDLAVNTKTIVATATSVASIHARNAGPLIPKYLSACSRSANRLSSACSCYIGTVVNPTTVTRIRTVTRSAKSTVLKTSTKTSVTTKLLSSTTRFTSTSTTTTSTTSTTVSTSTATTACRGNTASLSSVSLRIEGETSTIFEGPIISGPLDITTLSGGTHLCSGTNLNANPQPGATCTSALDAAACKAGFSFDGTYSSTFDDFFITRIANSAQTSTQFWGLLLNWQFTPVGGCQQKTQPGDEVLWAFDAFNLEGFLQAATDAGFGTKSKTAALGSVVTLYVKDGSTQLPVEGALIGGVATDANGRATLSFAEPGTNVLKAKKAGFLRSNAVTVISQ